MSDAPDAKQQTVEEESQHPPHAWLPDVHFGTAITPLPEVTDDSEDDEDEDEDDETVPPDVQWMLGFDPADEDDDSGDDTDADDNPKL